MSSRKEVQEFVSQGCIGLECFGGGFLGGMPFDPGNSMFGGAVVGPAGAGAGAGAGTSTPKQPGGGPVSTSEDFRAASLPVGPSAPTVSVMGPPLGRAWASVGAADFYEQVQADVAELIAYNNERWEANAPVREFKERLATDKGLRQSVEFNWKFVYGGKGPVPFDVAVHEAHLYDETMQMTMSMSGGLKVGGVGAAAGVVPSSRALGRALEAAGHVRPPASAAHHIVAGSAEAAAPARAVLRQFGIGINDAANGVFLPASRVSPTAGNAAIHSPLHTRAYYQAVNEALRGATTQQEALEVLSDLGQSLLQGGL